MSRFLNLLAQPGVLRAGLIGTLLQVVLGFANSRNIGGIADTIGQYGLSGQLTSGGLVAALTGLFYAVTTRTSGQTVAAGAGAVAACPFAATQAHIAGGKQMPINDCRSVELNLRADSDTLAS